MNQAENVSELFPGSRKAVVCVNSWAGRQEHKCTVVGETPKRCRIMVDQPTALPPKYTLLLPGMKRLVPKTAIRFTEDL